MLSIKLRSKLATWRMEHDLDHLKYDPLTRTNRFISETFVLLLTSFIGITQYENSL